MTDTRRADDLTLYYSELCPFCVRVLETLDDLGVETRMRDVATTPSYRDELVAGGGKGMVPCLRIEDDQGEVTWMYESSDIIEYLRERFDDNAAERRA